MLRAVVIALALALPPAAPQDAPPAGAAPVRYAAPADGPVVDPFRPPATPYGPGNRGLELATAPGGPVRAAAGGTVTFAGDVAGRRYVTVLHADRVRTTVGPLATVAVAAGDVVGAGQVVGASGDRLLWTARLGDAYVDPAILLAASGAGRVRLVAGPAPAAAATARLAVPACAATWAFGIAGDRC